MGSIVEWQSLRMQEYRYRILTLLADVLEVFGIRRPQPREPIPAGEYDQTVHTDHPRAAPILVPYLEAPATREGTAKV